MDLIILNTNVILKDILDKDSDPLIELPQTYLVEENQEKDETRSIKAKRAAHDNSRLKAGVANADQHPLKSKASRLDLAGPPLVGGFKYLRTFLCMAGILNWTDLPLYLSILYKLLIYCSTAFHLLNFLLKLYDIGLIQGSFENPIFIFIACLAVITACVHVCVNCYITTFAFHPIHKLMQEPGLCYLRRDISELIGTRFLRYIVTYTMTGGLLMNMLTKKNLKDFIVDFSIRGLVWDLVASVDYILLIMGICGVDFYIRSSFGHWILALRDHLEKQYLSAAFTHNNLVRKSSKLSEPKIKIIELDEIQKCLNNMDDHLEIMRSINSFALTLNSINAFLINGLLILLSYHLISNEHKYYHGIVVMMISSLYLFNVTCSYFGDTWLYYGLSSLVRIIEDEYFLQSEVKKRTSSGGLTGEIQPAEMNSEKPQTNSNLRTIFDSSIQIKREENVINIRSAILRRKHKLFFDEFLHQFKDHLASPWSNLTFRSHLRIMKAFVTLIAAQIIFDHEH